MLVEWHAWRFRGAVLSRNDVGPGLGYSGRYRPHDWKNAEPCEHMTSIPSRRCYPGRGHLKSAQAVAVSIIIGLVAGLAGPAAAQDMCWSPEQLAAKTGEHEIHDRGSAKAYRPVPAGTVRIPVKKEVPRGKVVRRFQIPGNEKIIALTFDLCEQPYEITGYQGGIIDYLRQENIPATFFASGKWVVTHPDRAQQIMADPLFEMGNHTWEHRNLAVVSPAATDTEISAAQLAYQNAYDDLARRKCVARDGKRLAHTIALPEQRLFRFPFGACNKASIAAVEKYGMVPIQWDVSSADPWKGQSIDGLTRAVLDHVQSGSIVLFHANGRGYKTGDALPRIIQALRQEGYKFMRIGDLMEMEGVKPIYSELCFDSKPHDVDRYKGMSEKLEREYQAFYAKHGKRPPTAQETAAPADPVRQLQAPPTPAQRPKPPPVEAAPTEELPWLKNDGPQEQLDTGDAGQSGAVVPPLGNPGAVPPPPKPPKGQ